MRHMTASRASASLATIALLVGTLAAVAAPASAPHAAAEEVDPPAGVWQFAATGDTQSFTVPDGVTALSTIVVGAAGQPADGGTEGPGASGMTIAAYQVTPGDILTVWVGQQGEENGGWGFACGGSRGEGRFPGYDGGGGGGASAITKGAFVSDDCSDRPADDTVMAVAGGGGGGGGSGVEPWKNGFRVVDGGAGGDGGDPPGDGRPTSQADQGGCGGCAGQPKGQDGKSTLALGGGAGGGGGGFPDGGGSANPLFAGGGGGGGDSFISGAERGATQAGTGAGDGYVTLFAGTSQEFGCTGDLVSDTVPTDAGLVHVRAEGGQGGTRGAGDGGAGGAAGALEALYAVTPGDAITVAVGCQSVGDEAAWGYADGGRRGIADDPDGLDGGGGGGSTQVFFSSDAFVVAGGGGGGGGNGGTLGSPGSGTPGGDGGAQGGAGVPSNGAGGHGGCGSCVSAANAPDGWHSSDGTLGGGGGGGGGGWLDGDGGGGGDLNFDATGGGGGGGGSGSSFVSSDADDYAFVEPGGGDGLVLLLWYTNVASTLSAYEGSKQSAQTNFEFAAPLAVKVTDNSGRPVAGVTVYFNLSGDGGAGGTFQDLSQNGSAVSDEHGIATSAPIFANGTPGAWEALAFVEGITSTARFALTNERLATSVDVAFSPSTVTPTEPVTATATVVADDPFFGTPTGAVVFDVGGTQTTVPLTDGKAALPLHDLVVGTSQVNVTYGGSAIHAPSVGSAPLDVVKTPVAIGLTASPNPVASGADLTFTATLVSPPGNTPCAACEVDFVSWGTATTDTDGVARLEVTNWSSLSGRFPVDATFAGNDRYASGAGSTTLVVGDPGGVSVTASPAITEYGMPLQLSGTIEPVAEPYATGTVSFTTEAGSKTLCSVALEAADRNTATCPPYSDLPVGNTVIEARYSGDPTHPETTGSYTATVTRAITYTTVSTFIPPNTPPGNFGIDVTVEPGFGSSPTGTVQLTLDDDAFGAPIPLPADGHIVLPPDAQSALTGTHTLTAAYSGDENYLPSKGSTTFNLPKATATLSLAGTPAASVVGDTVDLVAQVTPASGFPAAEGFVQFRVDGVNRGAPAAIGDGFATATIAGLDAGRHGVTATYLPTSDHLAAWGALTHHVSQPTETLLGGPPLAQRTWAAQPIEFKAHVTPFVPGGTIAFTADGVPIEGCEQVAPHEGTCTADALDSGVHTISTSYSGIDGYEASEGSIQVTVLGAGERLAELAASADDARARLGALVDRARDQVEGDRGFVACLLLRSFERQVKVYDRVGLVSGSDAEHLTSESRAVRSMLGCG